MQFDKISLFYIAPDATVHVKTVVSANGESCTIDGKPLIEVDGEIIQLGCIRMTVGALRTLAHLVNERVAVGDFGLIQAGDYKTADPNTRKPLDAPTIEQEDNWKPASGGHHECRISLRTPASN